MILKEIYDGWGNLIKDKLKILNPEIKEIGKRRLLICDVCEIRTKDICNPLKKGIHTITGKLVNGCGCALSAKVLSPNSKCPLGKF